MKKVLFNLKPAVSADDWVAGGSEQAKVSEPAKASSGPMKRLTLDISPELHTRIKLACVGRGEKMIDVLRDLLEREFPPQP